MTAESDVLFWGSFSDDEADDCELQNDDEEDITSPQSGLANVMAGILGKKKLPKKVVILAKGKTDKQIARKKLQKSENETGTEQTEADRENPSETIGDSFLQKQLKVR